MKIIKFSADWCGPCDAQAEILEGMDLDVDVEKVDVDENEEKANKYNVQALPTLVLESDDGQFLDREAGLTDEEGIRNMLASAS